MKCLAVALVVWWRGGCWPDTRILLVLVFLPCLVLVFLPCLVAVAADGISERVVAELRPGQVSATPPFSRMELSVMD